MTSSTIGAYCLSAVAWVVLVKRRPGHYVSRRAIMIVCDLGMVTFGMYMMGEFGASFYPLYLWVIVGNGMRYGPRYLYAAIGTGVVGFCVALVSSEARHCIHFRILTVVRAGNSLGAMAASSSRRTLQPLGGHLHGRSTGRTDRELAPEIHR